MGTNNEVQKMRKILYSPGYGSGWVSDHYGKREEKLFMLEYLPFIEFLESGGKFPDMTYSQGKWEDLPLVKQFMKDWDLKFPESKGDYPYFSALRNLKVEQCNSDYVVRITNHDGYERIEYGDEWL